MYTAYLSEKLRIPKNKATGRLPKRKVGLKNGLQPCHTDTLCISNRVTRMKGEYPPIKFVGKVYVDIEDAKQEVKRLTEALANYKGMNPEERTKKVMELRDVFNDPDVENTDKNRMAKALIDEIIYKREGDEVEMEVVFL